MTSKLGDVTRENGIELITDNTIIFDK